MINERHISWPKAVSNRELEEALVRAEVNKRLERLHERNWGVVVWPLAFLAFWTWLGWHVWSWMSR